MTITNKYPGKCNECHCDVPATTGTASKGSDGRWLVRCAWHSAGAAAQTAGGTGARQAPAEAAPTKRVTHCLGCGSLLDRYAQQRGYKFCSSDCRVDQQMGGQSGYVNGRWHQGSDD